jgi:hypothetical protein
MLVAVRFGALTRLYAGAKTVLSELRRAPCALAGVAARGGALRIVDRHSAAPLQPGPPTRRRLAVFVRSFPLPHESGGPAPGLRAAHNPCGRAAQARAGCWS